MIFYLCHILQVYTAYALPLKSLVLSSNFELNLKETGFNSGYRNVCSAVSVALNSCLQSVTCFYQT